ncbi:MAG: GAF domain-containing protein [bacterium]|nr:GAF domain-containing protein [bacterium]
METQENSPFIEVEEEIALKRRKLVYHSAGTDMSEWTALLKEKGIHLKQISSLADIPGDAGALIVILLDEDLASGDGIWKLAELAQDRIPLSALYLIPEGGNETPPQAALSSIVSGTLQLPLKRMSMLVSLLGAFRHAVARYIATQERVERETLSRNIDNLTQIGIALSAEQNHHRLLDLILTQSRELTKADAGSLYLVEEDAEGNKSLRFKHTQNDSKNIPFREFVMPATKASISGYVAVTGETLNIPDVYNLRKDVEYSFNKSFDQSVGYRSKSMLVVPMKDHKNEITGVLQLINAKPSADLTLETPEVAEQQVARFDPAIEQIVASLASQAAVSLENSMLLESIERTFEGLVKASVHAIEQRDPITSGHSERVTDLTLALAKAVSNTKQGRYADVTYTEEQLKELRYAGLLHDFGKIGVREHVLQKANKLYPMELEVVKIRFRLIRRTLQADCQEKMLEAALAGSKEEMERLRGEMEERLAEVDGFLSLVLEADVPSMMPDGNFERLQKLSEITFIDTDGEEKPYLTEAELAALNLRRGNLTAAERKEIESHASHSFNFLVQIPWTRELRGIPEIAHGHHEKLNGEGYPQGITEEQIPLQARMMCVCDIFDALTATDRPYKKAAPLDKAIQILRFEVKDNHLCPELMDIFVKRKVYQAVDQFKDVEYQEPESG